VPIYRGCINSNGTPAAFWDGGIGESLIIDRALTADEILKTTNKWST
jgi:predicted patatin/cPLA2 family phospholipase